MLTHTLLRSQTEKSSIWNWQR